MYQLDPFFMGNHSRKDVAAWVGGKLFKHVNIHTPLYSLRWLNALVFCLGSTAKNFYI